MVRAHKMSNTRPTAWMMLTLILIVVGAALFGLHYLGGERPQKMVELRVTPPVIVSKPIETAPPANTAKPIEITKAR